MKTRQELVEVIASELVNQYAVNYDVADMNASSIASFRTEANQILTAIEAAGARVVPEVATDEMIEAEHQFLSKGSFLSHPNVRKYRGPSGGDSPEIWEKDYGRARISSTINASPFKGE